MGRSFLCRASRVRAIVAAGSAPGRSLPVPYGPPCDRDEDGYVDTNADDPERAHISFSKLPIRNRHVARHARRATGYARFVQPERRESQRWRLRTPRRRGRSILIRPRPAPCGRRALDWPRSWSASTPDSCAPGPIRDGSRGHARSSRAHKSQFDSVARRCRACRAVCQRADDTAALADGGIAEPRVPARYPCGRHSSSAPTFVAASTTFGRGGWT